MTTGGQFGRSGEVDSLRALAMLAVIALHCHILPFGWIGVWLFYVISGYVVTASMLARDDAAAGFAGYGRFMKRRAVRILPVYYLYIAVGLAVAALSNVPQHALSIASLALFFDNVTIALGRGRIAGWPTGHLWTLSVEMQFYLLYGLALCLLARRSVIALLMALVLVCPLLRLAAGDTLLNDLAWRPLDAAFAIYAAPGLHFDIFAMGALLAFAQAAGVLRRLARPLACAGAACLALYAAVYVGVNSWVRDAQGSDALRNVVSGILIGEHREALLYSAIGLAMAGVVALAACSDPLSGRLLRLPALAAIGRISYGGYVYHSLALKIANMLLASAGLATGRGSMIAGLAQFALGCAMTLVLAWLSYRWFEKPVERHVMRADRGAPPMPSLSRSLEPR